MVVTKLLVYSRCTWLASRFMCYPIISSFIKTISTRSRHVEARSTNFHLITDCFHATNLRSFRLTAQIQPQDLFRLQRRSLSSVRYIWYRFLSISSCMRFLSYLTAFHDRRLLNSTLAENALTECKKIKAVTRIASQVCKRYISRRFYFTFFYSTSAMPVGDKGANNHLERCHVWTNNFS